MKLPGFGPPPLANACRPYLSTGWRQVSGEAYSNAACYERSLKLTSTDAMAWLSLGTAGKGMVSAEAYSEAAFYDESFKLDPIDAMDVWRKVQQSRGR